MKKLSNWDDLLALIGNGIFILAGLGAVTVFVAAIFFLVWLIGLIIH